MTPEDIGLPPHLQRMVNAGVSGLDILHGELKNLMLIDEQLLSEYTNQDEEEYDQTVDRLTLEGHLDALVELYNLTYQLSFAISDKERRDSGEINERNQQ
jgi:hypothetical protein